MAFEIIKVGETYKANKMALKVKVHSFGQHKRYSQPEDCVFLEALSTVADFKKGELFPYYTEATFLKVYTKIS